MHRPRTTRPFARMLRHHVLLLPLFLGACTQGPGDINVVFDPTTIVGLTLGGTLDPAIILYSTSSSHNGKFGATAAAARTGADALCAADQSRAGRSCTAVHAFISLSVTDEIADMPSNYTVPTNLPVKSPTGGTIGNNWADIFDGTLASSLSAAGVTNAGYWTYSNTSAALSGNSCNSGMYDNADLGNTYFGEYGNVLSPTSGWLDGGNNDCGGGMRLLCVCY